jgi:hypothetical protein
MQFFTQSILLVLSLAVWVWAPKVEAFVPLVRPRVRSNLTKTLTPGRPASPECQCDALYEFISEFSSQPSDITSFFPELHQRKLHPA